METLQTFLLVSVLIILLIRWIYIRNRLYAIESRIFSLERGAPLAAPRPLSEPRRVIPSPAPRPRIPCSRPS